MGRGAGPTGAGSADPASAPTVPVGRHGRRPTAHPAACRLPVGRRRGAGATGAGSADPASAADGPGGAPRASRYCASGGRPAPGGPPSRRRRSRGWQCRSGFCGRRSRWGATGVAPLRIRRQASSRWAAVAAPAQLDIGGGVDVCGGTLHLVRRATDRGGVTAGAARQPWCRTRPGCPIRGGTGSG